MREFSEETGEFRKFIYSGREIPTGTREKKVVERWRVNAGFGGEKGSIVN